MAIHITQLLFPNIEKTYVAIEFMETMSLVSCNETRPSTKGGSGDKQY